ncbi:MAG: carboxypeptidase-like regulatory domain-containing protein [Hymenobacter sp.]|nr:carboxypeptidase-like regulatory domain-containing protein [Hymenobacter sp.]
MLRGQVTDKSTGEGLPGVTVLLKHTTIGVSTSADGSFELPVPAPVAAGQAVLFSSVGFVTEERPLAATNPQKMLVALAYDTRKLGEVVVVGGLAPQYPLYTPRGLWQRLTRPFRH